MQGKIILTDLNLGTFSVYVGHTVILMTRKRLRSANQNRYVKQYTRFNSNDAKKKIYYVLNKKKQPTLT